MTTTGGVSDGKKSKAYDELNILLPEAWAKFKLPLDRISRSEAPCLDDTAPGVDSGYATAESTPSGKSLSQEDGACTPLKQQHRAISYLRRKVTKLRPFDKEIPKSTENRFADLIELFSEPLHEHLNKTRIRHGPISIKLKVIGEEESDATPWIIVLCDRAIAKKVRQFFDLPQVKTECQPAEGDSSAPSFKVLVECRPPRPIAASSYARPSDPAAKIPLGSYNLLSDIPKVRYGGKGQVTLCGTSIEIAYAGSTRAATLGGVVKVIEHDGTTLLFGLTAGHILGQPQANVTGSNNFSFLYPSNSGDEGREDDPDDDDDDDYDDNYTLASGETFELDIGFDEDTMQKCEAVDIENASVPSPSGASRIADGHIIAVSGDTEEDRRNHDWALVRPCDPQSLRPNLLVLA